MEIQYYSHLCACGCKGKLKIRKQHKWKGEPKYLRGHYPSNIKGGYRAVEIKQKISKSKKGKNFTIEHKKNIAKAVQGRLSNRKGEHHSEEAKQRISKANKGKTPWNKGKIDVYSEETKQKMRENHADFSLNNHSNWIDGKSFEPYSPEFNKQKKLQVLERDNYRCQNPNCIIENPKRLDCHHIDYDKKNNNPENLITLCIGCHMKTANIKNKEYWIIYYTEIRNVYL